MLLRSASGQHVTCALLHINISLVCGDLDKPSQVVTYQNLKSLLMVFLRSFVGHYTLLLPKRELPTYMYPGPGQLPTQDFDPRGGGDVHGSASVDMSWLTRCASPSPERLQVPNAATHTKREACQPPVQARDCCAKKGVRRFAKVALVK